MCHPGDILGVLFNADKKTLSYFKNGKDLGIAFEWGWDNEFIDRNVSCLGGLFPVISLEKEEAVLLNLGQFPFE